MTLNSIFFLFFLGIVICLLLVIQIAGKTLNKNTRKIQVFFLFLCSYFFIGLTDIRFCFVLLVTTVCTFFLAIEISRGKKHSFLLIVLGITLLLVALAYFKYMNFFLESIAILLGKEVKDLNILLPLGISFYIFTAIGYLIDVYLNKYESEKNFINMALLLCFFPKVISGPIVRGDDFLPQLRNYNGLSLNNFQNGIQIFVFGLFKKIVLADHLSVFVGDVFNAPSVFNSPTILLAVVSFSLQIYFDFSGYSDMSIGVSKILGFEIKANFNLPYTASNSSEFWGRWHISLSSWLRDYLYFPLGGNRISDSRTYLNLLLVMLLSGLWHGAGWTFILWGVLHGLLSCANKLMSGYSKKIMMKKNLWSSIYHFFSVVVTFVLVSLLWIPFRAENFSKAFELLKGCIISQSGISQPYTWSFFAGFVMLFSIIIARIKSGKDNPVNGFYPQLDLAKMSGQIIFFVIAGITVILGYYGNTAFIYGKF